MSEMTSPSWPGRLPPRTWLTAVVLFLSTYLFMWSYVHNAIDTRPCLGHLPDPLQAVIPFNRWWFFISHDVYSVVTVGVTLLLLGEAVRGRHLPLVRWGAALGFCAVQRSILLLLIPLCRPGVEAGACAIEAFQYVSLGPVQFPLRMWATNDLLFSGHIAEFIVLMRAVPHWPRWSKALLWVFQLGQAYALLATRGHYLADILLAIPCAYFADLLAMRLLAKVTATAPARLPALAPAPAESWNVSSPPPSSGRSAASL